ncbi:hypothetical protein [Microbacterium sp. T32]|uniref:hypothetical protein n=2 Tax=Bacteria TaxID=2 RepID=UPI000AFA686A|nr:hypothetical protein [Microbacterium sp. T32]
MASRSASKIGPHRTSGVQPHSPAALPGHLVSLGGTDGTAYRPLQQQRALARHHAELIPPRLTGDSVVLRLGGRRHGLPAGVELAPGPDAIYCFYRGAIFVFVATAQGIRQLDVDRELADRIRLTHFQK